jgi:DNA-binding PadR family transcriptional regulator
VPRDRGSAEPARYALLGLLLVGPRHGYDLTREFTPTSALGNIIHLGPSHLYALLGRLERDGFISGEQQDSGARPTRRVYRLEEAGRDAVLKWIDVPVDHPRDMRIAFPLKLYVALGLGPQRPRRLVDAQRHVFERYIQRLQERSSAPTPEADRFISVMQAGRIGRAQSAIEWLDHEVEPFLAWRSES